MHDTRQAVCDFARSMVDLPEVQSIEPIGPGVWRVIYADGKTFGTVYAGDHPRSGQFVLASDLEDLLAREARALATPYVADIDD